VSNRCRTREYRSWEAMKHRCTNSNHDAFAKYGGAGVTVCDRWLVSFSDFLADMGPRPPGTTLDRYPNNAGNYEPSNCRWATPYQQTHNRRPHKTKPRKSHEIVAPAPSRVLRRRSTWTPYAD
jgi:hypothetical protein